MTRYVIKRLLMTIPVMLGVILIAFCIRAITPGDPVDSLLPEISTEEQREALREDLGLNDPLPVQFINYVKDVFTGDLGTSYRTKQPVLEELLSRLSTTAVICFGAVAIGFLLGVPLGVYSAVRQYTWIDSTILVFSMIARSMPGFCLSFLLISLFAVQLNWLPAVGLSSWKGYIMPMFVVGIGSMAEYTRITRSSMLEVIRADYIRTAQAKGQNERNILWSHAFRNAAIPIIATVGNQVGRQLGGALIIENVFGIPGVGKYIGDAVAQRNFPSVQGGLVFLAFIFCIVNLLVDLSFTVINPRLKSVIVNTQPGKLEKWIVGKFSKKKKEVA